MLQKLFDIWYYIRSALRLKNFTILNIDERGLINYVCNNRVYKTASWPIARKAGGVSYPIRSATYMGRDVTAIVKQWAGPRSDFYGKEPDVRAMFKQQGRIARLFRIPEQYPLGGELRITNILGQESIFAAK
jgi:hypothetical protein